MDQSAPASTTPAPSASVLPYATPIGFQQNVISWRGKDLLLPSGASIADRCIRCNEAADGKPIRRNLTWHWPALYLLILFPGILVYLLVALIVRRRGTVYVGLCRRHRVQRRWMILIAWLIAIAAFLSFFMIDQFKRTADPVVVALIGIVGLLAAGIFAVVISQQLGYAKRIEGRYIWLRNVNRAYPAHVDQP